MIEPGYVLNGVQNSSTLLRQIMFKRTVNIFFKTHSETIPIQYSPVYV